MPMPIHVPAARSRQTRLLMDRRTFLGRSSRSVTDVLPGPGFEYMPGRFADDRLPIKWTEAQPEREPTSALPGEPLNTRTGLEPYVPSEEDPWDRRRALHLLRRTSYGADPAAIDAVLATGPSAAVDAIVDAALTADLPATPPWMNVPVPPPDSPQSEIDLFLQQNQEWKNEVELEFHSESLALKRAGTAMRERLVLFWHDHFVTSFEVYGLSAWLYRYWTLLRTYALGDFKEFVHEIGLTPAMLVYLNGVQNQQGSPNENYAREVMELFTMGIEYPEGTPNYTQNDIEELARVLTGWSVDPYGTLEAVFVPEWHDEGTKTVFGQTGNWGYDDVVTLLFGQRSEAIAHFIAKKLYSLFVYEIPSPAVVDELATLLLTHDFQLEPVVRTLLKSAHFFDEATMGARMKSPFDMVLGLVREAGFDIVPELTNTIQSGTEDLNQSIFHPPNVAGWPGYRSWIDTNTLPIRWWYAENILGRQQTLVALALSMPDPYTIEVLTADLAELFIAIRLEQDDLDLLVEIVLNGLPPYEWNPLEPGAENRLYGLVSHLFLLPEYQLN